ncbi:hypothetical protein HGRIS_006495 [Hohenbuehelia grisea]|uniref:Glutaminase A central domain-containing protein n=1 Tax=Hohenbuehelia grisea TaxID=104357 RepID=A0ABR3K379_9AGAR
MRRSCDTFLGMGQDSVNLALKGIIGVKAMSKISEALNRGQDSGNYSNHANKLMANWKAQAFHGDQLVSNFNDSESGGIMYNLYADKLLRLNFVDSSVYQAQTAFYRDLTARSAGSLGLPLVSGSENGRLDWSMFAAVTVNVSDIRDSMISLVHGTTGNNLSSPSLFGNRNMYNVKSSTMVGPAGWVLATSRLPSCSLSIVYRGIRCNVCNVSTRAARSSNHRCSSGRTKRTCFVKSPQPIKRRHCWPHHWHINIPCHSHRRASFQEKVLGEEILPKSWEYYARTIFSQQIGKRQPSFFAACLSVISQQPERPV